METLRSFPLRLLRGFLGFNSPVIEWAVGPLGPKGREVPEEWERESWWMQISSLHIRSVLGLACLHIATLQRNQPLMELLLENGADIDVQVRWPIGALPGPVSALSRGLALSQVHSQCQKRWHTPYPGPGPSVLPLEGLGRHPSFPPGGHEWEDGTAPGCGDPRAESGTVPAPGRGPGRRPYAQWVHTLAPCCRPGSQEHLIHTARSRCRLSAEERGGRDAPGPGRGCDAPGPG